MTGRCACAHVLCPEMSLNVPKCPEMSLNVPCHWLPFKRTTVPWGEPAEQLDSQPDARLQLIVRSIGAGDGPAGNRSPRLSAGQGSGTAQCGKNLFETGIAKGKGSFRLELPQPGSLPGAWVSPGSWQFGLEI